VDKLTLELVLVVNSHREVLGKHKHLVHYTQEQLLKSPVVGEDMYGLLVQLVTFTDLTELLVIHHKVLDGLMSIDITLLMFL